MQLSIKKAIYLVQAKLLANTITIYMHL